MSAVDRLDEIQARADAATPGPWDRRVAPEDHASFSDKVDWIDGTLCNNGEPIHLAVAAPPNDELAYVVPFLTGDGPTSRTNAEFLTAARTDVPALVAALRAVLDVCDMALTVKVLGSSQADAAVAATVSVIHEEIATALGVAS